MLGAISYIRVPATVPPVGAVENPSLHEVMGTLRGLFVPLLGKKPDTTRLANGSPIPILMYHYIRDNVDQTTDPLGYGLSVPPAELDRELQYLAKNGYTTVTLDQVARGEYGKKSVALTFDDGYKDFISEAYPLLEKYGFTATAYIITGRLNDPRHLSRDDIVYLANRGIAFGSHTVGHVNLAHQSAENLSRELVASKATLSDLINKPITALSYPSGQYNAAVVQAAHNSGYTTAVTTVEGTADPSSDLLRLARIRIRRGISVTEFARLLTKTATVQSPISTDRVPGS